MCTWYPGLLFSLQQQSSQAFSPLYIILVYGVVALLPTHCQFAPSCRNCTTVSLPHLHSIAPIRPLLWLSLNLSLSQSAC